MSGCLAAQARQGHRYRWCALYDVLALETGRGWVRVAMLAPGEPWLGQQHVAAAADLMPLPMRYFHGEVPR